MIKEIKFENSRLEVQLRAQSPMIHFQPDTAGVTVRASEVKPKLDKFLLGKLTKSTGKTVAQLKKDPVYKDMFLKEDSDALRYKMQIAAERPSNSYTAGKGREYGIFYGNMGSDSEKKAVFSDPKVIIQCFHGKIRDLLEKYLIEFFLVTNFGTMQGKGFGSFAPLELTRSGVLNDQDIQLIGSFLKESADAPVCYCMKFDPITMRDQQGEGRNQYSKAMFEEIKCFYGIMKSGQNFGGYAKSYIFKYMLERKFDNEKAWLKHQGMAPKVATSDIGRAKMNNNHTPDNPRYVRAMLGIGSHLTYRERGKKDVTITISSAEFERVSSPIYFKIVGNVVFIVAKKIPGEVYDKTFTFESAGKKKSLNTPKPEEFDLQEMLKNYVAYYNGELRRNDIKAVTRYKKVEKI